MRIAILGAGIAGLTIGRKLNHVGIDFTIFEKEKEVGGLARTNKSGKYNWDFGVHALYSPDPEIMDYYEHLPIKMIRHKRKVAIWHKGKPIGYPFENHISDLPTKDMFECIHGYLMACLKGQKEFKNLQDWIDNRLGYGIAKHFMTPYNRKIWSVPLNRISMDLVKNKIHPMTAVEFVKSLIVPRVGRVYQAEFLYPENGIGEFPKYLAKGIKDHIRLGVDAKLRKRQGKWYVGKNGFDLVVSTIPLPVLLGQVGIKHRLKWNNTYFVHSEDDCDLDYHWAFFKEDENFYRTTHMSNFSPKFKPSIVFESTHTKVGHLVEYTYPIPTVGLPKFRERIRKQLAEEGIYITGRGGSWTYLNMDDVIKQTGECYNAIISDCSGDS